MKIVKVSSDEFIVTVNQGGEGASKEYALEAKQSVIEAQQAVTDAEAQVTLAQQAVTDAESQVSLAAAQVGLAEAQATLATAQAGIATDQASLTLAAGVLKFDLISSLDSVSRNGLIFSIVTESNRGGNFVFKPASDLLTVDNGIIFAAFGGGFWVRQFTGPIHIAWFATGDGSLLDSNEFVNMIVAGGENAVFIGSQRAVYLIDTKLEPLKNQKFIGNGATIKRANQVKAILQNTITLNTDPTALIVDDASDFRVGSWLTITTGGGNTDKSNHKILSITGNDISVGNLFTTPFSVGAQVISSHQLFVTTNEGIEISGWIFDGNRSNWQNAGLRWENISEIIAMGNRNKVYDNYLFDSPAECIMSGGIATIVHGNYALNVGGNGVHLSGGTDQVISENRFENCNLIPVGEIGHEDGCIAWSLFCERAMVTNNVCINGLRGLGSPAYELSDRTTITGNTVINCVGAIDIYDVAGNGAEIIIANNRFYNSGYVNVGSTKVGATEAESNSRVIITNNFFNKTFLKLQRCRDVLVEGNKFFLSDADLSLSSTSLSLVDPEYVSILNNTFDGYYNCIYANSLTDWVEVRGNVFRRGVAYAANFSTPDNKNISFIGNTVIGDAILAASNYFAVALSIEAICKENIISVPKGSWGILADTDCIVQGNVIKSVTGIPSIKIYGGTTGAFVVFNYYQIAPAIGGTHTVANNYTIT